MQVLRIPKRLWFGTLLLYISVPLSALEVILLTHAPWWRLPYRPIAIAASGAFVISSILSIGVLYRRIWTIPILWVLTAVWSLTTCWLAVFGRDPGLAFFSVFLIAYWVASGLWIRFQMSRSYLSSGLKWYQGAPRSIPGLKCKAELSGCAIELNVSRFDEKGAFLFADRKLTAEFVSRFPSAKVRKSTIDLAFTFRGHQVVTGSYWINVLERFPAVGVQFQYASMVQQKELGDFIELLKGEGYV